jgi:predicted nucleotide-binding protein
MIREIGGSPHVLLDDATGASAPIDQQAHSADDPQVNEPSAPPPSPTLPMPFPSVPVAASATAAQKAKPIFIGHGKNTAPLQKLESLLSTFQIPYKVTVKEANLGRPIPQKVRDTMEECGSAILLFTKDELFYDADKKEIWRPSENVVNELGAAAFLYGDRIVIFKEKGLHFPTNYQSIGYIEFEVETLEAKTADLLKELIGFGLVKVMPT